MGAEAMAIGAGIQLYGQMEGASARRSAERQNAQFYREQAALEAIATERELDIFDKESAMFMGDNISLLAKSGVDLSGSLLVQLASDRQQLSAEREGIAITGRRSVALSDLKAKQADKIAKDMGYAQTMQGVGTLLNIGGGYMDGRARASS